MASIQDILSLGVYLTTAVKCGKTGYGIATKTNENCSHLLEKEQAQNDRRRYKNCPAYR